MKTKADVLSIIAELKKLYPDGICSLDYPKPYEPVSYTHLDVYKRQQMTSTPTLPIHWIH